MENFICPAAQRLQNPKFEKEKNIQRRQKKELTNTIDTTDTCTQRTCRMLCEDFQGAGLAASPPTWRSPRMSLKFRPSNEHVLVPELAWETLRTSIIIRL